MADSDPRKIRPFGQTSDRRNVDSDEDPLVELARIVSEDSAFYGARTEKPKPAPVRDAPIDRDAYSADLESELLQELESSFSSRRAPAATTPRPAPAVTPPRPAPAAAAQRPPVDDADELLRSIEKQLGEFERRSQATRSAARARPAEPQRPASRPEPTHDDGFIGDAPEPAEDRPYQSERAERLVAEARERIGRLRPADSPSRSAPSSERGLEPRVDSVGPTASDRQPAEQRSDSPRLPLRRRDTPADTDRDRDFAGYAAGAATGWSHVDSERDRNARTNRDEDWRSPHQEDYRSELRTTFGGFEESRGVPTRADRSEPAGARAERRRDVAPIVADASVDEHWQGDVETDDGADEPRVAAALPGNLGARRAPAPRGFSRRAGLLAAVAVLGVAVIGGAAAMYLRSGEAVPSGPPPVIAAPEGDVKVETEAQAQAEGETVGEAVYNRVAGNAPATDEQVVDGAEEPREISRIVLPQPQEEADQALARPVGEPDAGAVAGGISEAAAVAEDVGPRRVRTYVVRPDGTISETVADPAAQAAAVSPAEQEQQVAAVAQSDSEPMVPVRVATTEIDGSGQPQAVQPEPNPAAAPPPPAATTEPATAEAALSEAALADAVVAPAPEGSPPADAEPATVSALPAPTEPAPAPAAAAADGYVVQISSQRSMADAQSSWASAQSRYASVLGGMQPDIQEADLGAKGVYYRVRVGPWASRAEAVGVCESLRSAGGDCIVTR